jgi:S-adenosylmethionine synthetase
MASGRHLFSSEAVGPGHPDKVADQISDAILDAILAQDPRGRVACETLVTTGTVIVAGEITTKCYVDIPKIVRETIRGIGYTDPHLGFDWETVGVLVTIDEQSPDIYIGVEETTDHEQGAGDQGLMFGYACNETPEHMPMTTMLARKMMRAMEKARIDGILPFLRPDGKGQVTIEYDRLTPRRIQAVVCSWQHSPDIEMEELRKQVKEKVLIPLLPADMVDENTIFHINPTGRFVLGGPTADTGLTGRKIIADTYGGRGSHGGGCFSGKDPTKVDRSASLAARWVAKNVVAAGLAQEAEVQIAYAIGVAQPVSFLVETNGTGKIDDEKITEIAARHFDLRPSVIIEQLNLRRPIYRDMARYGHFGREGEQFTWERTDKAAILREEAGL